MNHLTYTYNPATEKVVPKDAVVLDLKAARPGGVEHGEVVRAAVESLRKSPYLSDTRLAEQIEEQTKPPRIPEPGLWAVVGAATSPAHNGSVRRFVRHSDLGGKDWVEVGGSNAYRWDLLVDPVTLVRDGIES